MSITAIIIEDEPKNIRVLRKLIEDHCPEVSVLDVAQDIRRGKELIEQCKPRLVFLDIEMPHGNAFDLIDALDVIDFNIIFITAFSNYAVKAFRYGAMDYLLKPVDIDELKQAVGRIAPGEPVAGIQDELRALIAQLKQAPGGMQKIAISTVDGMRFLYEADIVRLEASLAYTVIYTTSKEKIVTSKNISEFEQVLPPAIFFRVHKSHIINLNKMKKYQKGRGGFVVMEDGTEIEVASRRREAFLRLFS